jgi:hypothetical protein
MKRSSLAGVGALAFGVLLIVGLIVENAPGGSYSANDVADYVRSGHRPLVFVALYLGALGVVGLVFLLARLRAAIADQASASVFWGLGLAAAGAITAGYALTAAVPIAMGYGGKGVTLDAPVTYVFSESGWAIMTAGCILLGSALLTFARTRGLGAWLGPMVHRRGRPRRHRVGGLVPAGAPHPVGARDRDLAPGRTARSHRGAGHRLAESSRRERLALRA